jgi:selenoprotein W-related protein
MRKPRIEIEYCRRCNFLLRAGWTAQELLHAFGEEIGELALIPGSGGHFIVRVEGDVLFSRRAAGRFPDAKELKQLLRDHLGSDRPLGHAERSAADS